MVSLWGGREHFIIALAVAVWAEVWKYFDECGGPLTEIGEGYSVSGEGEAVVDAGESSRGRFGMACGM